MAGDKGLRQPRTMPLPGAWGRGAAGVTLPLPPVSPPLLLPPFMPLKLSSLSPARRQRWAARWGPGGHGVGAAPRAGSAARPAAARSPSRPGTEGTPAPTSSSAEGAWGSTRPAGRPKVMGGPAGSPRVTVPAACSEASLTVPVFPLATLLPEVAKILPDSFSQDFRDPWRRAGLLLPEELAR